MKMTVQQKAQLFGALSDATRLEIVSTLMDGPMCVSAIQKKLKKPQPSVSSHLGILRMHGVVECRRQGKMVFYSVSNSLPAKVAAAIKG